MGELDLITGEVILIVYGEAENCPYEEKIWVAHVVFNRLRHPEKFGSIEKDFKGYTRPMKITNSIERRAFKDAVSAVITAAIEHVNNINRTNDAVFFARKDLFDDNTDPVSIFGVLVEEVETPESFKHKFFKLR